MSRANPEPKKWRAYNEMKDVIEGTRFLPFKTPWKGPMPKDLKFDVVDLLQRVGNLGFVLNLVKTRRYYNTSTYEDRGVTHFHIPLTGGGRLPSDDEIERVFRLMDRFIKMNADDKDKLIGVHCTHGVNRTGYVICRYMIRKLGVKAEDAIKRFEVGRGHKFDHQEYVDHLHSLRPDKDPSVAEWHSIGGRIQRAAINADEEDIDFARLGNLTRERPSYPESRDRQISPPRSDERNGSRAGNRDRGDFDRDRQRQSSSSSSRSRRERRSRSPLRNPVRDRRTSSQAMYEEERHPSDRSWRHVGPRNPRERYSWPERYVGPRRAGSGQEY